MKIFLVEDSPLIRDRLHAVIAEIGVGRVIAEAEAPPAAIAGIAAHRPDLVVLDLNLAGGSGLDVLRAMKSERLAAKVMVLTNYSDLSYRRKCLGLGAQWFFDKTLEFERVGETLRGLSKDFVVAENRGEA